MDYKTNFWITAYGCISHFLLILMIKYIEIFFSSFPFCEIWLLIIYVTITIFLYLRYLKSVARIALASRQVYS